MTELKAHIALNMVPDMGAATFRKLVAAFGSAEAVASAGRDALLDCPGFSRQRLEAIASALESIDPSRELAEASKIGIQIIAICDAAYPALLKEIYDPPICLYCFGDLEAFSLPSVAIVGTRTPSLYGTETARRFASAIASAGYCVTSGMARGIDTSAHQGALDSNGRTIAVLGGAIDCFYPSENRELGRTVAKSGGLIVSEFPLKTKPSRITFPRRNRIISGLSRLTLVIEAAARSGSLITASQAAEQNRPVMAVPGRIDMPNSIGCNLLIRDGAQMALSPNDVLDELESLPLPSTSPSPKTRSHIAAEPRSRAVPKPFIPLSSEEQHLLDAVSDEETLIDDAIRKSRIDAGRANALMIALQLKRLVEILPGGWVRKRK